MPSITRMDAEFVCDFIVFRVISIHAIVVGEIYSRRLAVSQPSFIVDGVTQRCCSARRQSRQHEEFESTFNCCIKR